MDGQQRRAIIYGNSLILEGVRASLAALPGLEVLDKPLDVPFEPDQTKGPTTVIFDLEAIQPESLRSLLQDLPICLNLEKMAYILSDDIHKAIPPAVPSPTWKRVTSQLANK